MHRRRSVWTRVPLVLSLFTSLLLPACGGGSPEEDVERPLVRAFSPFVSPFDFSSQQQNPSATDGMLSSSTDPAYPGKIVIYFQERTAIDPASVFTAGDPAQGVNLSALAIMRIDAGFPAALPLSGVTVDRNRIIATPAELPLPNGQYTIGVFDPITNTDGEPLAEGPVFHSFFVGGEDNVPPAVVTTTPLHFASNVGAGTPVPVPPGDTAQDVADIRAGIFGPTSPDVVIRFSEPVDAATVTTSNVLVVNASLGGGQQIQPAPGYPRLKVIDDGATLPSNGHEVVWRPDPSTGAFPFNTNIKVTLVGLDDPDGSGGPLPPANPSPIADLTGNALDKSFEFQFLTLEAPDLPQNPFPGYAVWWAGSDRIGTIDTINQQGIADVTTGVSTGPVKPNVVPQYTDTVATAQNIPGFEPTELSIDARTNGATCHTWVYAMSPNSEEIVVVDSRTSLPVAIINTPAPGGLSNQTGGGTSANVLMVTNASANTLTTFDIGSVTPGLSYVNGPIFVQKVVPTGNTPRAVTISSSGDFDRGAPGPLMPLIMYVDFTDGVVNTTRLTESGPVKQFNLGASSRPNDVALTPCLAGGLMFGGITQAGTEGRGKVAYYVTGPGCQTGVSTSNNPDSIVGDLTGFENPAGLDEVVTVGAGFFAMAESGADQAVLLNVQTGANQFPVVTATFSDIGANPTSLCHRPAYGLPCVNPFSLTGTFVCSTNPACWYNGTDQQLQSTDTSVPFELYICARGSGQVSVVNMLTGLGPLADPANRIVPIPTVRFVATAQSQ